MKKERERKTQLIIGFVSGVVASLCCLSPLLLALIGLAGVSAAVGLWAYLTLFTPFVFLFSGIFLVAATYVHLRRAKACSMKGLKDRKYQIMGMILTWIITYLVLAYAVVPYMFKILR